MTKSPVGLTRMVSLEHRSIEFGSSVIRNELSLCQPTHFVLPQLPGIISQNTREFFRASTQSNERILTLSAALYDTTDSLREAARIKIKKYQPESLLVVGGNTKSKASITTCEALSILQESTDLRILATWDPNHPFIDLQTKMDAGAAGVITQPVLSTIGWKHIDDYFTTPITGFQMIPGIALPKNTNALRFWSSLLEMPPENDDWFNQSLERMTDKDSRQNWSKEQLDRLLEHDGIHGLHFMPMGNTEDLLNLFVD